MRRVQNEECGRISNRRPATFPLLDLLYYLPAATAVTGTLLNHLLLRYVLVYVQGIFHTWCVPSHSFGSS